MLVRIANPFFFRGEHVPAFPVHAQPAILQIWQEAPGYAYIDVSWLAVQHNNN